MTVSDWLSAASATAYLGLAMLALVRRTERPLAQKLALMSLGLFAYNMLELLSNLRADALSLVLLDAVASLLAIPTCELFVGFLGRARRDRPLLWAVRGYFALLSLWAFAAGRLGASRALWAVAMLVGLVPTFAWVGALLLSHVRSNHGAERRRAQLLAGALLLGIGSVLWDLGVIAGADLPRLSYVGLFAAALLVAAVTLRARIVEGATAVTAINTSVVALFAVALLVSLTAWLGDRPTLWVLGALVAVLVVALTLGPLASAHGHERERERYLLTLGRFSQQMAHDLRNPLAAIQGAAQFLKEERRAGRSLDGQEEFLDLILERTQRMERLIREYQRMGRLEPSRAPLDVAALVEQTARGVEAPNVRVALELGARATLPRISADSDLLAFALENLMRNGVEAMPDGGLLSVRAEPFDGGVRLTVADTGVGMDPRTLSQAQDEFFTTKAAGSGLGLAFVRRVVDAHGGRLTIESEEGQGTRVSIELAG